MLDINRHKFILVRMLKDIYSDIEIASLLGFKGGTAVYLFYDLPRFSVDLDFNLLDIERKETVLKRVELVLKKYGELKEKREKRFTLFFLVSYSEEAQNIKVEISKNDFPDTYEIKYYLGIPMLVMKKDDMFAHKLVALLERKFIANRDIFDIWFFMKNKWNINKNLIRLRTKMNCKQYIEKCVEALEGIDNRFILQGLGEILDEKQKIWVKNSLKKEVMFLLRYYKEEV